MSTLLILVKRATDDEEEYQQWIKDVRTLIQCRWSCLAQSHLSNHTDEHGWFFQFFGFKVSADTARTALGTLQNYCVVCRGGENNTADDLSEFAAAQSKWQVPAIVTKKKEQSDSENSSGEERHSKAKKKKNTRFGPGQHSNK